MQRVVVYHPGGYTTQFEGEETRYEVQANGSLIIYLWETPTEIGNTSFAVGQWERVLGAADKPADQATQLVVTMEPFTDKEQASG